MARKGRLVGRERRRLRARKRVIGTAERPRLSVFRSSKHIYAQIIDDSEGRTLAAASTLDPDLKGKVDSTADVNAARQVGSLIAKRAKGHGIDRVVFDRGGNQYHGRVASVAEGAREAGLQL